MNRKEPTEAPTDPTERKREWCEWGCWDDEIPTLKEIKETETTALKTWNDLPC